MEELQVSAARKWLPWYILPKSFKYLPVISSKKDLKNRKYKIQSLMARLQHDVFGSQVSHADAKPSNAIISKPSNAIISSCSQSNLHIQQHPCQFFATSQSTWFGCRRIIYWYLKTGFPEEQESESSMWYSDAACIMVCWPQAFVGCPHCLFCTCPLHFKSLQAIDSYYTADNVIFGRNSFYQVPLWRFSLSLSIWSVHCLVRDGHCISHNPATQWSFLIQGFKDSKRFVE